MQLIDNFERKFLFGLTRLFAMLVIVLILIAVGIGGVLFGGFQNDTSSKISTAEIMQAITPPPVTTTETNSTAQPLENNPALPSVKLPFVLQKHFNTPENLQVMKDWLDTLSVENRQEFIDEMAAMVTEAEKRKLPPYDAIDKYRELKFEKLKTEQAAKAEQRTQQLYYAGAVVGAVALIALFSLILVLLAIERNTRRSES